MLRVLFALFLLGLAALGGAWLGVRYAPVLEPTLIDLSAFSPELRDLYRDKAYLDEVETRFEMEKVDRRLNAELATAGVKELPDGLPPFPLGRLLAPPFGSAWMDAVLQGDNGALAEAKNGWVVINLWATWCVPCVSEMPDVGKAAEQLDGEVSFFLLNADATGNDTLDDVAGTYARQGVQAFAPLHADAEALDAVFQAFGMTKDNVRYPANMIYAPGGEPWAIFYGGPSDGTDHWSSPEGLAFFRALSALPNAP